MTNLKKLAEEYEPTTTNNISELSVVNVDIDVTERICKEGTPDQFKMLVTNIDGVDYRVPYTVLANLNAILLKKPDLKQFAVSKAGSGLGTTYTVIPL